MTRNIIDNHKLIKKPKRPDKPHSPKHDVDKPKKHLPRPHKRK